MTDQCFLKTELVLKHGENDRCSENDWTVKLLMIIIVIIVIVIIVVVVIIVGRERGGREAEQEERQKWNQREQQRILDSVRGTSVMYIYTIEYVHH